MNKSILFYLAKFKCLVKSTLIIKSRPENLSKPENLSSEVSLDMVKVGLNPLIKEHYFKYLAYLDNPKLIQLWEGEDWKFEVSDEQLEEIQSFIKSLDSIPDEFKSQLIHQYLMDFLPEMKVQAKDEKTKYLVNRIINDKPLYFKKNLSFFEKLEKINKEKDGKNI